MKHLKQGKGGRELFNDVGNTVLSWIKVHVELLHCYVVVSIYQYRPSIRDQVKLE